MGGEGGAGVGSNGWHAVAGVKEASASNRPDALVHAAALSSLDRKNRKPTRTKPTAWPAHLPTPTLPQAEEQQLKDFGGDYEYYLSKNDSEAAKMAVKEARAKAIVQSQTKVR